MLVVSRFRMSADEVSTDDVSVGEGSVGEAISSAPSAAADFAARAHAALAALAARPEYLRGWLGRSIDEPEYWCLVTEWESVGAYRRALSAYEVKVYASPLLAEALAKPSGYEVLARTNEAGELVVRASDRAPDANR